jgi:hypothetical protein
VQFLARAVLSDSSALLDGLSSIDSSALLVVGVISRHLCGECHVVGTGGWWNVIGKVGSNF